MRLLVLAPLAVLSWLAFSSLSGQAQEVPLSALPDRQSFALTTASPDLSRVDSMVNSLTAVGDLQLVSSQPDLHLVDHVHDSFRQFYQGIPVRGGSLIRQRSGGEPISIFGTMYEGIEVDVTPRVSATDALALVRRYADVDPVTDTLPELLILPTLPGEYVLAWRLAMGDYHEYQLDAQTGELLHREPAFHHQSAVGSGHGIAGGEKKVSTTQAGGRFEAHDRLRPGEIVTLDLRFSDGRLLDLLVGGAMWTAMDVASSPVNTWSDAAVVDAHAYAGFTYDYLYRQHGWSGLDNRNGRIISMVNAGDEGPGYNNALFVRPPFGPERTGAFVFGAWNDLTPLTAVDIVAHELMHGVTYSSVSRRTGEGLVPNRWGILGPRGFTLAGMQIDCGSRLEYGEGPNAGRPFGFACHNDQMWLLADHAGAINEAFSDIIGAAVELSVHDTAVSLESSPPPLVADYVLGEDSGQVLRSLADPRAIRAWDDGVSYPDAFRSVFRFLIGTFVDTNEFFWFPIGSVDGGRNLTVFPSANRGGLHWNSTILSHAYFLAVEGGRNRTTGLSVQGVGRANRGLVERAFFRAMTHLMPSTANFAVAAAVIRQSAHDLYGANSDTFRAIDQALNAVDLPVR